MRSRLVAGRVHRLDRDGGVAGPSKPSAFWGYFDPGRIFRRFVRCRPLFTRLRGIYSAFSGIEESQFRFPRRLKGAPGAPRGGKSLGTTFSGDWRTDCGISAPAVPRQPGDAVFHNASDSPGREALQSWGTSVRMGVCIVTMNSKSQGLEGALPCPGGPSPSRSRSWPF